MNNIFEYSANVIPLSASYKKYVDEVQKAMFDVISYIEQITQVRYYPVSTYIVDEFTIQKLYPVRIDEYNDLNSMEFIEEILRFLTGVSISFHSRCLMPEVDYMQYTDLPYGTFETLRQNSEFLCFALKDCITGKLDYKDRLFIKGISKRVDYIENFFDNFHEILKIYKNVFSRIPDAVLSDYQFDRDRDFPNLAIWRTYLGNNQKDLHSIIECIDKNEKWKKDLASIITATIISLNILKKLIKQNRQIGKIETRYSKMIKNIETYGVYLHRENDNQQLIDLAIKNGLPGWAICKDTGKVLICIETIEKDLEELHSKYSNIDNKELARKFIKSILIHEHMHAANFEGVSPNSNTPLFNSKGRSGFKYELVYESIAEWAELNYFRNDPEMFEIIEEHAEYQDDYKQWPYAGAMLIEKRFEELGIVDFQSIFNMSRVNLSRSYCFLRHE